MDLPLIRDDKVVGNLSIQPDYKPGDPAPSGYIDRQGWARVQLRAGLRQVRCSKCSRYKFPQELAAQELGKKAVCLECDTDD